MRSQNGPRPRASSALPNDQVEVRDARQALTIPWLHQRRSLNHFSHAHTLHGRTHARTPHHRTLRVSTGTSVISHRSCSRPLSSAIGRPQSTVIMLTARGKPPSAGLALIANWCEGLGVAVGACRHVEGPLVARVLAGQVRLSKRIHALLIVCADEGRARDEREQGRRAPRATRRPHGASATAAKPARRAVAGGLTDVVLSMFFR